MSTSPLRSLDGLAYLKSSSIVELPALVGQVRELLQSRIETANLRGWTTPGAVELSIALQRVFDWKHDCILWEEESPCPFPETLFGCHIRFDPRHGELRYLVDPSSAEVEANAFKTVEVGTGIRAATELARERSRLGRDHWIVAVLSEEQFLEELDAETVRLIQSLDSRLLFVVRGNPTENASTGNIPAEEFPAALKRKVGPEFFLDLEPAIEFIGPVDGCDVQALTGQMIRLQQQGSPAVLYVETRETSSTSSSWQLQKAETLTTGEDVAILAVGDTIPVSCRAAEMLEEKGISTAVVNMQLVQPLDRQLVGTVSEDVSRIVILEQSPHQVGFVKSVLEALADSETTTPVTVLELPSHLCESENDGSERVSEYVFQCVYGTINRSGNRPLTNVGSESVTVREDYSAKPADLTSFDLSEESLQREREEILATELSTDVKEWFDVYSQVGHRTEFLWKWCTRGSKLVTLPCVLPKWIEHVRDTKILSIMLCVLLDDVADEQGNEDLLEALLKVVENQSIPQMDSIRGVDRNYARVTLELSRIYDERIRLYPLYGVYRHLHHFDLMQYFNTMRYSCLLNQNLHLLNVSEHELYLPHAMHMMSFSTLDLMCSPDFDVTELGVLREAVWYAQCMGRVGNLLSTWSREIDQKDFTSGVFARAVTEGDLTVDLLKAGNAKAIETAIINGRHEEHFFQKWFQHRECFINKIDRVQSVDLQKVLESQERFFLMHLACRGII